MNLSMIWGEILLFFLVIPGNCDYETLHDMGGNPLIFA
jgi:hypothetical protein